ILQFVEDKPSPTRRAHILPKEGASYPTKKRVSNKRNINLQQREHKLSVTGTQSFNYEDSKTRQQEL
ncbi:MAG: hypothetical protein Q3X12_09195, partial [Hallella sp.]|nr:hypothetical protein [Hallella sp.]